MSVHAGSRRRDAANVVVFDSIAKFAFTRIHGLIGCRVFGQIRYKVGGAARVRRIHAGSGAGGSVHDFLRKSGRVFYK